MSTPPNPARSDNKKPPFRAEANRKVSALVCRAIGEIPHFSPNRGNAITCDLKIPPKGWGSIHGYQALKDENLRLQRKIAKLKAELVWAKNGEIARLEMKPVDEVTTEELTYIASGGASRRKKAKEPGTISVRA